MFILNFRMSFFLSLLIFLTASFEILSQRAEPDLYFVKVTGSDNNSGDYTHPFKTITYALTKKRVDNGLTIQVMYTDGNPFNEYVEINLDCDYRDPVIIEAVPGEVKPVFYGSNVLTFYGNDAVFRWRNESSYITLDGLIIENCTANNEMRGIWVEGNNNVVRNCEVRNVNRTGIALKGNNNIIEDNIVENIIGAGYDNRGNNISVETYVGGDLTKYSNFNIIQRNILKDNPTHFGVNMFPDVNDESQPIMFNNTILYNYIENTGGGIFTRLQRDMDIIGNIIVNSTENSLWGTTGGAITFHRHSDPYGYPFYGGVIRIYNNTIVGNHTHGIENNTTTNLYIYNNIFVDNYYQPSGGGHGHVVIKIPSPHGILIDNNIYFGFGCWKWDSSTPSVCDFSEWQNLTFNRDVHSNYVDPVFVSSSYKPEYLSPVKNKGKGLLNDGVEKDYSGNPRPFWNQDFDIGAYEVEDTQLKFTTTISQGIIQYLTSYGNYWERNSIGVYNVSSDQGLHSASSESFYGISDEQQLWKFPGVEYKWMDWSNNSSTHRIAAGFYKISNSNNSNSYFYLDLRDAVVTYNLNLYLQLFDAQPYPYYRYYQNGSFLGNDIPNGSVKRIWEIDVSGVGNPTTAGLLNYWQNSLVQLNGVGQNPRLVWGPSNPNYTVERNIGGVWASLTPNPVSTMEYIDGATVITIPRLPHQDAYYRVKNSLSTSTNIVFLVINQNTEKKGNQISNYEFMLNQNYPNPFNPSTTISFSLANQELVRLKIFDITGREISTLVDGEYEPGFYNIEFNASSFSSGVYFYQLTAGEFRQTKKLQVLK